MRKGFNNYYKNEAGNKVRDIIKKHFGHMNHYSFVVIWIISYGWEAMKNMTEEEIEQMEGNDFISKELCKEITRTAVEICKTCSMFDDFLSFVKKNMYLDSLPSHEITINKSNFPRDEWDELIREFGLDYIYEDSDSDCENIDYIAVDASFIESGVYQFK